MKKINGFNNFSITKDGRVFNTKLNLQRKLRVNKNGYSMLTLYEDGKNKTVYLHRLLAEAYIPNPDNLPVVRHLNDNKDDNRLENLAWGTKSDNEKDKFSNGYKMHTRKLDAERVRQIRMLKGEFTQGHLSYLFGVDQATISRIHNNKIYTEAECQTS